MKDQVHVASRTPASSTFGGQILGHVTAKAIKSTAGLDEHDPLIILDKMEAALKRYTVLKDSQSCVVVTLRKLMKLVNNYKENARVS